jgi:hypothetical protein
VRLARPGSVRRPAPRRSSINECDYRHRLRALTLLVGARIGSVGIVQDAADEVCNARVTQHLGMRDLAARAR